jgi:glycosyltransferase involved in cell wall biosynthesis
MIEFFPRQVITDQEEKPVFSILIPSWNNLPYLKCCISSIIKNSRYKHQIIVHVNDGSEGTKKWVKEQNLDFSWSDQNVGVCYAFNAAASLAKTNYLLLLDDDNYLLPDWDYYIHKEIEEVGHPYFAISATKIEYTKTLNTCVIAPHDFGQTLEDFKEDDLLEHYKTYKKADWYGSSWYPMAIHKHVWDIVGGLSIEYSPGMYSDPDFMMKLWHAGVRYFKGLGQSLTYHFMSKSVSRIKKNNGRKQFLLKWRMSNSAFRQYYLKMGEPFKGPVIDPPSIPVHKILKDKIKLFFTA